METQDNTVWPEGYTAIPNPSGFRTVTLPTDAPAQLFAARLVRELIDFNYSYDSEHHFVYPVKHYGQMKALLREVGIET